ncbi:MAG: Tfp pilus assembly protein PilF [Desulfovibrionaceae bacterium]
MTNQNDMPIKGVFSSESSAYIGHGGTKRKVKQNVYIYVEEDASGNLVAQALNGKFVPSGSRKAISRDTLFKEFLPEPMLYMAKTKPLMEQMGETLNTADRHRARHELFAAEFEYKNLLAIDEEHVRATFGLGLTYLQRNEIENGRIIFQRILDIEGAFEDGHRHLFNDFGIMLRKTHLYDEALRYYEQARTVGHVDDHLLYNMARVHYENGNYALCLTTVAQALELNPDLDIAKQLQDVVRRAVGGIAGVPRRNAPLGKAALRPPAMADAPEASPANTADEPSDYEDAPVPPEQDEVSGGCGPNEEDAAPEADSKPVWDPLDDFDIMAQDV